MLKKTITTVLAMFMIAAAILVGTGNTLTVRAAADDGNKNLLVNPDFEDDTDFGTAASDHRGNWFVWRSAAKTTEDAQSGSTAVKFTAEDSALEQDVSGLIPGNIYVYTIWARLSEDADNAAQTHSIGVKNYGGKEEKRYVTSSEWTKFEIEFKYVSGNPRVYGYVATHNGKDLYIDNASVSLKTEEAERTEVATYYVDSASGNDANDGLSPEKAFASIEKLNMMTFIPGDEILFKRGENFVGCFRPRGSGSAEAPIKIGSYGEGEARPVLQPGEDWTVEYIMSANAMVDNPKVNYVLQFYNVEYWEVSDLELFDPSSNAYLTPGSGKYIGNSANDVYRSGITIQAEDIGTLEHFYIDNVIIHGFHGPGTNIGKTSGGITMNVITNKERDITRSVPTQINDIRITNCEIYDVGRSGINFLTPWSFREDEKWGPFNYGTRGYDYLPYEDFYMANNYIHDIDGDGTIIDNCSNAVAEYNLVTRCCLRPQTEGGGAAVGLFNWNSDDTIFQFNEVYDIRPGSGASASNDSQGIEIDALNDRTWVQYNYVHDNTGGFMMLCNVSDNYRSFDGIVRYNISQNDYAHPRQGLFDIYSANYGTEIYNNTFYLTERALKDNQIFLFSEVGAYDTMKFYNNIFYYDGQKPVAANQFGDNAIDWQSNIFYGFANMPANDNESAPNLNVDPMVADMGKGGTGEAKNVVGIQHDKKIGWVDLSCYQLQENSPAVSAGVPLEKNGGRDYFGNPVTGLPDIGAYESGSITLKVVSTNPDIVTSQESKTITVASGARVTARTLMASFICEDDVVVSLTRNNTEIAGGIRLAAGDVVTCTYNGQSVSYIIVVAESEEHKVIPVEHLEASAGSEETSQASDYAANVLDGNTGTMWHTAWGGTDAANRYLTLNVKDGYQYEIAGYVYTPRTAQNNGIINEYEICVSDDNANWNKVAEGTWNVDASVKTVIFDQPVQAKYVKLLAVTSEGGFASAAEARLLGKAVDTVVPTIPAVSRGAVTENSVEIKWTKSEDNNAVVEYVLLKDGEEIGVFDPDMTSYVVKGLEENTSYEFAVYAVDGVGNKSSESKISVTTKGNEAETISYSIIYNLNGGENSSENPTSYTNTTPTITLKNPTRTGYTFKGWYSDSTFTEKMENIPKGSKGDKVFYAKWSAHEYSIAFKGNENTSGSMKTLLDRQYGTEYILSKNTFKRTGYTFAGWNTKKDGSGTAYADKASVKNLTATDGKKVTLYAQWKLKTYSITYVLKDGENSSKNPTAYTIETSKITLKNPSRIGYTFAGWYKDEDYTKRVKTIKKGSYGNKTLYAKWTAEKYDIKYKLNGGRNSSKNPKIYKITTKDITLKNPSRIGYIFAGWYSDKACTKPVETIAKGSYGDKTLYAKWEAIEYSITYKLNGGKNSSKNPATYTVEDSKITLKNPTRKGYTFKGWYSDAKYTKRVKTISEGSIGNKNLYAKWSEK